MVHGGTSDDDNAHTNADNADNTYYYYPSIGDVLKTRAILHQLANCNGIGLPIELVDMIIDEAEYWPSILTEMPRSISIMQDNDRQCLLTPPLCYDLVVCLLALLAFDLISVQFRWFIGSYSTFFFFFL